MRPAAAIGGGLPAAEARVEASACERCAKASAMAPIAAKMPRRAPGMRRRRSATPATRCFVLRGTSVLTTRMRSLGTGSIGVRLKGART